LKVEDLNPVLYHVLGAYSTLPPEPPPRSECRYLRFLFPVPFKGTLTVGNDLKHLPPAQVLYLSIDDAILVLSMMKYNDHSNGTA
jgi:hypothetical protein